MRLINHALRIAGHSCAYVANSVAETLWPAPAVQRAHAAAEALADVEAEEEVGEPAREVVIDNGPPYMIGRDIKVGEKYCGLCGVQLGEEFHHCPVLQQTTPAGVDGETSTLVSPPPVGTGWLGWAVPAVLEVLADHMVNSVERPQARIYTCRCSPGAAIDEDEYREHVAPIIAARIACDPVKAIAALRQSTGRSFMESGQDMGASFAKEFYPQHTKPSK